MVRAFMDRDPGLSALDVYHFRKLRLAPTLALPQPMRYTSGFGDQPPEWQSELDPPGGWANQTKAGTSGSAEHPTFDAAQGQFGGFDE